MTAFPADVSMRIIGNDIQSAQELYPLARQLLTRALMVQGETDKPVQMRIPGADGSLVRVVLTGNLKHVYITPPPPRVPPAKEEEPFTEPEIPTTFPYDMWSGVVRPTSPATKPQVIHEDGLFKLDQFHPDEVTAGAYAIPFAWQKPERLAVNSGGAKATGNATSWFPKPGNYSGAMKRCVQAILGIGNIDTDTLEFISGEYPPTAPDLHVWNQYAFQWDRTHGIHKGADGSLWLVEVSKLNGVLAMPLPIFRNTDSGDFLSRLAASGDTDTMSVVLEFGGLPTGEKFPTGTDLADAIAAGKVLQLLAASDILEFYRDTTNSVNKGPLWTDQCWAFSESGAVAANMTFWYKNPTIALADPAVWATDGYAGSAADLRYKMTQHWRLTLNVTQTPSETSSYGSGSAVLDIVEETVLVNARFHNTSIDIPEDYIQPLLRIPLSGFELTANMYYFGRGESTIQTAADIAAYPSSPIHVFYIGETIETVRSVPATAEGFAVNSFVGDTLDLGIPAGFGFGTPGHVGACVGLLIPAFCREGYVLIKGEPQDAAPAHHGTFPIDVSGIFTGIGRLDFPRINEYFYSNLLFGNAYNMVTWPAYWLTSGQGLTTFASPIAILFGISQNHGVTGGYVANNGIGCAGNLEGSVGDTVTRPPSEDYTQSDSVASLEIPIDVKAEQVTFVGCP